MSSMAMKPRRLKGHKASLTCCIASTLRPGIIASSDENGCICWFDLRCKDVLYTFNMGEESISSLCFKTGTEDMLFASSGTKISCFDIKMAAAWKPLQLYNHNKDEINQITFSPKSNFLAAADDSGDVKIIDTCQQSLYRTLRSVHTNICSSVQFVSWKPWTAITGGLDLKIAIWDFSRGRPLNVIDYGISGEASGVASNPSGQSLNPPMVHSIALPEQDVLPGLNKVCAVARGDGAVHVIDVEAELATMKSKGSSRAKSSAKTKGVGQDQNKSIQLDHSMGGHSAGVSCVTFSMFAERGKLLISGGNDSAVKLWDWSSCLYPELASCSNPLSLSIDINKKVNWLCSTPTDMENLIVCDTSKVLKAYTIQ